MDNNRIRKILNRFETLVAASITDESRVIKYNTSISNYRKGMCILWQRNNYSNEDIKQFQRHIDTWFQVSLNGRIYKLHPHAFIRSDCRIHDEFAKHALLFTAGVGKV